MSANIPRFFVFWGLVNFNLWLPIWVLFFQDRGLSLTWLGFLEAPSGILMAMAEVATGAVADRWGRKTSMIIGSVAFGAAVLGLTTRILSPLFIVAYLGWGAAYTFISGADMAFLYDSLKADGRAGEHQRMAGRYLAIQHASAGAAGLLGGWLATVDMRLCFYTSAAAMLVAAGVAASFREPPRFDPGSSGPPLRYRAIVRQAVAVVTGRPLVRYQVLFGAAVSALSFLLLWVLLQPYSRDVGLSLPALGVVVLLVRAVSMAGSMLADPVARRIGAGAILGAGVLALAGGQLALWAAPSTSAVGVFVLVAFVSAAITPVLSALLNREIPSAQRATIISIQQLLWAFIIGVVELPLLALADRIGVPGALGALAILSVVCLVPLLALWWRATSRPLGRGPAVVEPGEGMRVRG